MVIAVLGTGSILTFVPYSLDYYSPPASMFNAPLEGESIFVYGIINRHDGTPIHLASVRLFATDELKEDYCTTDSLGHFESNIGFLSGQVLTIYVEYTVNDILVQDRFTAFISYSAWDNHNLGIFTLSN